MKDFITEVDILDESKETFLTYSAEVLTDRAIPAAEDGLLSAQRKLLWTMEDYLKMNNSGKTKKCNAIVGSTLATSYFHGDISCYGVLCKMSQEYLMRYPLIHGQGSLGTQENNDMVASSRYTEAKPSKFADIMMEDFNKNVVPLKETYNGEFMEPVILPALFPNAICNGRQAIGISMAHNSLPHNLSEVCDGIVAYIKNNNITTNELMTYIKGPDFPLPNVVVNSRDIKYAFENGNSNTSLKVRGIYKVEGQNIIFTSIPYRTYRNKIKEQIEKNIEVFDKLLDDFNDESSLGKNKLVFTVKKGINIQNVVNTLFNLTDLQTNLSYNMNYIVNGTPKMCSMIDLIKAYVEHQINVLLAATNYDKEKAEHRKHILDGLIVIIKNLDKTILIIRNSDNTEVAKKLLIKEFNIDEIQAKAVLDMKLGRLTKLDNSELLKELEEKIKIIDECNKIINDKTYRDEKLINKIIDLKNKYGDDRRTELLDIKIVKEEKEKIVVEPEKVVVVLTEDGAVKRIPSLNFKVGNRNTKGVKTQSDIVKATIRTNTVDSLLVFSNLGKVYRVPVNDIPVGTNSSQGQLITTLVQMGMNEKPCLIYSVYKDTEAKYIVFVTEQGLIKKTALAEFANLKKKGGSAALKLRDDDKLTSVALMNEEDIILVTNGGMGIRFNIKDVSPTGKTSMGVKGMNLKEGDYIVAAMPVRDENDGVAIFSETGLGKRIKISDLSRQARGGKGVIIYKPSKTSGSVVTGAMINDSDNVLLVGNPNSLCISGKDIPVLGRTSSGNQLIKGGKITSVSKI